MKMPARDRVVIGCPAGGGVGNGAEGAKLGGGDVCDAGVAARDVPVEDGDVVADAGPMAGDDAMGVGVGDGVGDAGAAPGDAVGVGVGYVVGDAGTAVGGGGVAGVAAVGAGDDAAGRPSCTAGAGPDDGAVALGVVEVRN
jgi:hypothetical protein